MLHINQVANVIFQSNPTTPRGLEHAFQLIFPLFVNFLEKTLTLPYDHPNPSGRRQFTSWLLARQRPTMARTCTCTS